jgi:hypothetical protein
MPQVELEDLLPAATVMVVTVTATTTSGDEARRGLSELLRGCLRPVAPPATPPTLFPHARHTRATHRTLTWLCDVRQAAQRRGARQVPAGL